MQKNQIRLLVVVCGLALMFASAMPASSYPGWVREAAKYGAKDCLFCHLKSDGGEGWNERGKWLMEERDRRKADSIETRWLAEYKPGAAGAAKTSASAATLTPDEKQKAIELLKQALEETISAVEGVSEAQWNFKAADDKWSVAQVSEHILKSEGLIFGAVNQVTAMPANPDWATQTEGKTELMMTGVLDRSQKFKAPEQLQPSSGMSKADFISQFRAAREKTIRFVAETSAPLKEHTMDHPVLKTLNGYQWLLLIPLHNQRHNLQIKEVMESSGYPK